MTSSHLITTSEAETSMPTEQDIPSHDISPDPLAVTTSTEPTTPAGTTKPATALSASAAITSEAAAPEAVTPTPGAVAMVAADSGIMSAIRDKFVENPLPSILGGIIVVLLSFILADDRNKIDNTNNRIDATNARINDTNDRIASLEVKMVDEINDLEVKMVNNMNDKIDNLENKMNDKIDNLENKMNDKTDNLENKIDDVNMKLTALIAALNKTREVDASLSGTIALAYP